MEDLTQALLQQVVVPVLSSLLMALGAWVLTKVPGPLRDALAASVHAKDVKIIVDAAARRATAIAAGHITTASPVNDVVAYVRTAAPDVVAKLAPTEEAMKTIAAAAVASAATDARLTSKALDLTRELSK